MQAQPIASYKLNTTNAKQAGLSQTIVEKGQYAGLFTRAEAVISTQGTQGIEFSFRSTDGQTSDYLTLWTVNSEGKELSGRKMLDALMTCMKVREINVEKARIKKRGASGEEEVDAPIFPSLMNKPVGLLLIREEYAKDDGSVGFRMVIVGAYDPATNKLPVEILDQKPAELLPRVVERLQDRPLKQRRSAPPPSASGRRQDVNSGNGYGGGFDAMDDDIPF